MGIMNKDMIEKWIVPHLTVGERGFEVTTPLTEIVECIFHRLKTGCQWRELPTKEFFTNTVLSWNTVYYHFNKCGAARAGKSRLLAENLDSYFEIKSKPFGLIKY